jgi:DNA-binding transcriptional LysR family regulator
VTERSVNYSGYDLAMRVTREDALPPGLIARPLRTMSFYLAASREYLKRHGTPESPEDLARHDFVAVGNHDSLQLMSPNGKIEVRCVSCCATAR